MLTFFLFVLSDDVQSLYWFTALTSTKATKANEKVICNKTVNIMLKCKIFAIDDKTILLQQ